MIAEAVSCFGGIDILHNNAALLDVEFTKIDQSFMTINVESWDRILAVNLRSMMVSAQAAIPDMIKRGGGSIINTASTLGLRGDLQLPAYSASKAGVTGLTRQIAAEFGKNAIRCNAVAPGLIMTQVIAKWLPEPLKVISENTNSMPYLGRPEDIGATVAFLASDDARYITGQTIAVDGGATMQLPTVAGYRAFQADQVPDAHVLKE
jgi:NAD(P)-dependent dehydrogenase (short-subunit alcohol dehydrogenase family)